MISVLVLVLRLKKSTRRCWGKLRWQGSLFVCLEFFFPLKNFSLPDLATWVCRWWDSNTQLSACGANAQTHCASASAQYMRVVCIILKYILKDLLVELLLIRYMEYWNVFQIWLLFGKFFFWLLCIRYFKTGSRVHKSLSFYEHVKFLQNLQRFGNYRT